MVLKKSFIKRSDAGFVTELSEAQKAAAKVQPGLDALVGILKTGEEHKDKEASPRWLAGFDLALGTALVHKVRAQAYNQMLAKAKRGIRFENEKNNTWVLKPSKEITVGSKVAKEGNVGVELLQSVVEKSSRNPMGTDGRQTVTDSRWLGMG